MTAFKGIMALDLDKRSRLIRRFMRFIIHDMPGRFVVVNQTAGGLVFTLCVHPQLQIS